MLVLIIGLPGTGKTTIAKWLSQNYHIKYLSTEELRAEYLGLHEEKNDCDFTQEQQTIIYELMVEKAREIIDTEGAVIVEGVYRSKEQRNTIYQLFSNYMVKKYYFWITCNEEVNRYRVIRRKDEGTISPSGIVGFERVKSEFVSPDLEEPFVTIDNTFQITEAEKLIKRHIASN